MPRVFRLSDQLISKIAAGEVIERPYSVVKELVENSIDAGAKEIQVEVEEGGRKRVTVIDDGCGMSPEDARLALERHATSKLGSEEDLFRIQTLGFRGEALPSIAAISWMVLESAEGKGGEGVRIEIEGGRLLKETGSSLVRGTRITVQNLFFNTPARLKFLKSKETEFSHIAAWLEAVAIGRPDVGFVLRHNGKVELRSDVQSEHRLRIRDVLGEEIAEFLHPVSFSRGSLRVEGFVSDHRATSTSAKSFFFFVNGRIVRDRTLQHAVLSAYENLLMVHRYPWVTLHLEVPPGFVDVNVHPTKAEVRFANASLIHDLVRDAVRQSLRGESFRKAEDLSEPTSERSDSNRFMMPASSAGLEGRFPPQAIRVIGQVHATYLICETEDKLVLIDQHAAHERIGYEKLKREYESGGVARQQLLIPQNFDLRPSESEVLKKYLPDLEKVGIEVEFFGGNTFIIRSVPILLDGTDFVSLVTDLVESLQSFEKLSPLTERIHEVLERIACHRQVRAGDRLTNEEIAFLLEEMKRTDFRNQCPHGRPSILQVPFNEIEKWFKRRL